MRSGRLWTKCIACYLSHLRRVRTSRRADRSTRWRRLARSLCSRFWQQLVAARWTAGAVASYSRRRHHLAEVIYAEVTAYERAHRDIVHALGATAMKANVSALLRAAWE